MKMNGNTILITGGGSGIGRGLAEAFYREDNKVIIAGRRQNVLDEVTSNNPGMSSLVLDLEQPESIADAAGQLCSAFPDLNIVIHNAGIMRPEQLLDGKLDDAEAMVVTNFLGPIRMTAALLPHLTQRPQATIITVSSGLAFVPLAATPTYCATKAAIHSWTQSLRYQLRDSAIEVLELAPPYVQTELMGPQQASDPHAMPLDDFIRETMSALRAPPSSGEMLVERVKPLRNAERADYETVFHGLNQMF